MLALHKLFKKRINDIIPEKLPLHIAVIMDGNGRWAQKRNMPRIMGHREGAVALKRIARFCGKIGIKYLTVYAFSTENWNRSKAEVDGLMDLLLEYLKNADREIGQDNVRIRVIGNISRLPVEIQNEILRVTKNTESNDGLNLIIALNYGGRDEIVNAVKSIVSDAVEGKLKPGDITEETVSGRLYTAGIPDPDLIIRPSGEKRISNFLLWQSSYSEYWFSNILWPDFSENDLMEAILDFQKRNRRYGGV